MLHGNRAHWECAKADRFREAMVARRRESSRVAFEMRELGRAVRARRWPPRPPSSRGPDAPTRVVVDTDSLRTTARYLQGALDQLTMIRQSLTQVGAVVDTDADQATRRLAILAWVERLGAALTEDHRALGQEILELEAQEGDPPAGVVEQMASARPARSRTWCSCPRSDPSCCAASTAHPSRRRSRGTSRG